VRFARERQPTGYAAPIAKIPHVREQVGRMDATLMAARSFLLSTATDWDERPADRRALAPEVAAAKRLATNGAVEVVDIAMRIVGGVALVRGHPLERHYRDVRGGLVNPPIEARALEIIARAALDEPAAT
jgi:alkylation response protein AidB-like acyl-CoA dehydrogenase